MLCKSRSRGREPRADEMDRCFRVAEDVASNGRWQSCWCRRGGGKEEEAAIVRAAAGNHVQRA